MKIKPTIRVKFADVPIGGIFKIRLWSKKHRKIKYYVFGHAICLKTGLMIMVRDNEYVWWYRDE